MRSLNKLIKLQRFLVSIKRTILVKFWGMDIHHTVVMSLSAKLDKTYPKGIHIDSGTYIAFDAAVLSHDMIRRMYAHTYIGKNCFIGARSIILPGIRIGDGCVVAAGSVVTKNIPSKALVGGNPARILSSNIEVEEFGRFKVSE